MHSPVDRRICCCRELCRRHGATIGYERRALVPGGPEGNEFFVSFAPSENRLTQ